MRSLKFFFKSTSFLKCITSFLEINSACVKSGFFEISQCGVLDVNAVYHKIGIGRFCSFTKDYAQAVLWPTFMVVSKANFLGIEKCRLF